MQSKNSHFTPLYFSQRKIVIFGLIMTSMDLFPEDGGHQSYFSAVDCMIQGLCV